MILLEFLENLSMGGWTSLFVIVSLLIEVAPIKINPIGWLGNRLNASMYKRVDEIEGKLDTHIAEGYRNYILNFQRLLLSEPNTLFTYEEWKKAIKSCQDYENYCKDNNIANDIITQAIIFIRAEYQEALQNNNILSLPIPKVTQI